MPKGVWLWSWRVRIPKARSFERATLQEDPPRNAPDRMSAVFCDLLPSSLPARKEHAMLSPVRAASNISLTSQKQAAIAAENLAGANSATAAIALSDTINAGVEGKLNILLLAARARMVDSLLAVIDAASKSINVKREAGDSNASFA